MDSSTSTILKRPRGRPRKNAPAPGADVSLASTIATTATPRPRGRSRKDATNTSSSIASAATTPRPRGGPRKNADTSTNSIPSTSTGRPRGRPRKSADVSLASTAAPVTPRPRGRPRKDVSVSFDDSVTVAIPRSKGRPRTNADTSVTSTEAGPTPRKRGRPRKDANASVDNSTAAASAVRGQAAEDSDVSLIDGASDAESDASEDDAAQSADEDEGGLSSDGESGRQEGRSKGKRRRKGWPTPRERLRKWRKLSLEERECVTSEGGLIWRTAIPLLNSMPKNVRSMVADSLARALNRIDGKLEAGLVPPLPRVPTASGARRELASSMLSWRLEEEGSLLRAENADLTANIMNPTDLGMNAEIAELEQMLLPEAEQIIELNKTLQHQSDELTRTKSSISKLRKDRKAIKNSDSGAYPGDLEAHKLVSIITTKPELDLHLAPALRMYNS
ncbi:hypothetical protein BCV70DRAFT_202151 [Testicularia cyperi]|uniref:Uncharacterized protein n=1 Tax=Testicularia cyperi TaxID=1882483 RepID=A0A317XJA3_9BASI|nr:hypothetical protein BCV70DRAFT_202151 [Testicularia cyperi]